MIIQIVSGVVSFLVAFQFGVILATLCKPIRTLLNLAVFAVAAFVARICGWLRSVAAWFGLLPLRAWWFVRRPVFWSQQIALVTWQYVTTSAVVAYARGIQFRVHMWSCWKYILTPLGALRAANALVKGMTIGIRSAKAGYPITHACAKFSTTRCIDFLEIMISGKYRKDVLDLIANSIDVLDLLIDGTERKYHKDKGTIEKTLAADLIDSLVEKLRNASERSISFINYTWTCDKTVASSFEFLGVVLAYYVVNPTNFSRVSRYMFKVRGLTPTVSGSEIPPPDYNEVNKLRSAVTGDGKTIKAAYSADQIAKDDGSHRLTTYIPHFGQSTSARPGLGFVANSESEIKLVRESVVEGKSKEELVPEGKWSKVPEQIRDFQEQKKRDKTNAGESWDVVEAKKPKSRSVPMKSKWNSGEVVNYNNTQIPMEDYKYIKSVFLGFADWLAKTDNRIKPQNFAVMLTKSFIMQMGSVKMADLDQQTRMRVISDEMRSTVATRIMPSMYVDQWREYVDKIFKQESLVVKNQPFDLFAEAIQIKSQFDDGELNGWGSIHMFKREGKDVHGLCMKRHTLYKNDEEETPVVVLIRSHSAHKRTTKVPGTSEDEWVALKDWQVISWDKEFDTIVVFARNLATYKPLPLAPSGDYKDVMHYVHEGSTVCAFTVDDDPADGTHDVLSNYSTLGHGSSGKPIFVVDMQGRTCVRGWHTGSVDGKSAWMPIGVLQSKNSPFRQGSSG